MDQVTLYHKMVQLHDAISLGPPHGPQDIFTYLRLPGIENMKDDFFQRIQGNTQHDTNNI